MLVNRESAIVACPTDGLPLVCFARIDCWACVAYQQTREAGLRKETKSVRLPSSLYVTAQETMTRIPSHSRRLWLDTGPHPGLAGRRRDTSRG